MTVREWFEKGRKLDKEVSALKEAKQKAFELAYGTSADTGNERVQQSHGNTTEDKFTAYADYSRQLEERTAKLLCYRKKMHEVIDKVDNPVYRALLTERYINCKTWEQVADDMGNSVRWIHRLQKRALKELEEAVKPLPDTF